MNTEVTSLPRLGQQLKERRKQRFPRDDQKTFGFRIGVSRATYQKMEKGDLSVSMQHYFAAARLFEIDGRFDALFEMPDTENLFDKIDKGR